MCKWHQTSNGVHTLKGGGERGGGPVRQNGVLLSLSRRDASVFWTGQSLWAMPKALKQATHYSCMRAFPEPEFGWCISDGGFLSPLVRSSSFSFSPSPSDTVSRSWLNKIKHVTDREHLASRVTSEGEIGRFWLVLAPPLDEDGIATPASAVVENSAAAATDEDYFARREKKLQGGHFLLLECLKVLSFQILSWRFVTKMSTKNFKILPNFIKKSWRQRKTTFRR